MLSTQNYGDKGLAMVFNRLPKTTFISWAEAALSDYYQTPLSFEAFEEVASGDRSLRCLLAPNALSIRTIIAKFYPTGRGREEQLKTVGYEVTGLRFLSQCPKMGFYVPRLYAVHPMHHWLLLEDVGENRAPTLLAEGADPDRAKKWLIDLSCSLGSLHNHTVGRERLFYDILESTLEELGLVDVYPTVAAQERAAVPNLMTACMDPSLKLPKEMREILKGLLDPLLSPEDPYASYCLKDPKLDHFVEGKDRLTLIDFEACYFHLLGPANFYRLNNGYFLKGRIPHAIFCEMEASFRKTLIEKDKDLASDVAFDKLSTRLFVIRLALFFTRERRPQELILPSTWGKWITTFAHIVHLTEGKPHLASLHFLASYALAVVKRQEPHVIEPPIIAAFRGEYDYQPRRTCL